MQRRNIAWGAVLALPVVALLLSWVLPDGSERDVGGVISIPTPGVHPSASPPSVPASTPKRLALVATQQEADLVSDQSLAIATERRDAPWAERSEAAIAAQLRRMDYIGGRQRLDVHCAATLCEVVGIAAPDAASNSFRPVWQALERDTAGDALRAHGLERVAAIFDTGRNPDEFKIQYRRIGS